MYKKNQLRTLKKLRWFNGKIWYGYLTYPEVAWLLKKGAKLATEDKQHELMELQRITEYTEKGIACPIHQYLYLSNEQESICKYNE